MKRRNPALNYALAFLVLAACTGETKEEHLLAEEIQAVKTEFAPDKRVALFDITTAKKGDVVLLKGESNLPNAVLALKEKLEAGNIGYIDSIEILPSLTLEGKIIGLVNNSVANIRSNPKHSAELATQATLGTPLKIYKKEGDWLLVQTPDQYISWVDDGGVVSISEEELATWKGTEKIIYTETIGSSYSRPDSDSQVVSDLVAGSVLEIVGNDGLFYVVRYPDGRQAYVSKKESEVYGAWLEKLNPDQDALVATSKKFMGVPYLWGGTSTKGMDCSGFTKTIYFLNGMVLPRDASQQVHTGKSIDSVQSFENLQKGDLLFFGRKATDSTAEKVVHVGMWIGNKEFIHASNMVRISSMDPKAVNFDAWNRNRYLRTKRILKEEDKDLIHLARNPVFR